MVRILFLFLSFSLFAQADLTWNKVLGGDGNDEGVDMIQLSDGNLLIIGYSDSDSIDLTNNYGLEDLWVIKTDPLGNIIWQNSFGGLNLDRGNSCAELSDGRIVIGGDSGSFAGGQITDFYGNYDVWLLMIDENGNLLWQKTIGGSEDDRLLDIAVSNDRIFFCGKTESDDVFFEGEGSDEFLAFLGEIDLTGELVQLKTFGGSKDDQFTSLQIEDNFILALGSTKSIEVNTTGEELNLDVWLAKLDLNSFDIESSYFFGGSGGDSGRDLIKSNNGGYFLLCETSSIESSNFHTMNMTNGFGDFWLIETDENFNLLWEKAYGGFSLDVPYSIVQKSNNDLILAGITWSTEGDVMNSNLGFSLESWIFSIDEEGNFIEGRTYGGSKEDFIFATLLDENDNYFFCGSTDSSDGDIGRHGNHDVWIGSIANMDVSIVEVLTELDYRWVSSNLIEILSDDENIEWQLLNTLGQVQQWGNQKYINLSKSNSGINILQIQEGQEMKLLKFYFD